MGATQQFSLRWNNYVQHITSAFDNLRSDEDLVDVTLSCEGKKIYAHKMLLSACSNYFKEVFKDNPCKHPVIIFRNVNFDDLVAIIDFMYHGEVNVEQDQLSSFLTTAEMLAVQGLSVGSTSKDELRKRQPVFVDTSEPLASTVHDGPELKQSSKLLSRPLGTQNPPGPAVLQSRPITPTGRKRRLSPPAKPICYKESFCKKKSRNMNPVKLESDDIEDDNSFEEEEDGMIDVSQLEVPLDEPECEPPVVKLEAPPSPDANEKALARDDLAGPQSKVGQAGGNSGGGSETAGHVSEEYLEEDDEYDNEEMIETAYVLVDDNGHVEYVNESALHGTGSDDEAFYVQSTSLTHDDVNTEKVALILQPEKGMVNNDEERTPTVEYIYAEGVGENNEIIIGGVPKFDCPNCDRSFKRIDSLRKHESVHRGMTECPACGSVFSRVTHLVRHMRIKHPNWSGSLPTRARSTRQKQQ